MCLYIYIKKYNLLIKMDSLITSLPVFLWVNTSTFQISYKARNLNLECFLVNLFSFPKQIKFESINNTILWPESIFELMCVGKLLSPGVTTHPPWSEWAVALESGAAECICLPWALSIPSRALRHCSSFWQHSGCWHGARGSFSARVRKDVLELYQGRW